MNLSKIWLIAKREYLTNFRRRSFLITAFVLPLMTIGVMTLILTVFAQNLEDMSAFKSIGIVDQAGVFTAGATIPAPFRLVASPEEAAAGLKDKTLDGYYVLPADFLSAGKIDAYNRPDVTLNTGASDALEAAIKQTISAQIGSPALSARLQAPLDNLGIYRIGSPQRLDANALVNAIIVPIIFGLLIYMSITVTSQFLMSGMVEEKENRMMEVLMTSSRPSEMLWGKLLGLGALGLTQLVVWGLVGLVYAASKGTDIGTTLDSLQLTPGFITLLVVYFVLGYLLFGALMSGIGASVNADQEGRQIASILSMMGVLPFIFSFTYLTDPNGVVPTLLSLFPFTAPVGMILRISWTSVPPAQIALSLAILVVSVIVVIWLSGRIFRLGMLSYGKRLGVRDIIQAFREGRQTIVTGGQSREAAQL